MNKFTKYNFKNLMCIWLTLFYDLTERRRKSSHKPLVLSEARKQLLIYRLPQVLRLHLKRFRYVSPQADLLTVITFITAGETQSCLLLLLLLLLLFVAGSRVHFCSVWRMWILVMLTHPCCTADGRGGTIGRKLASMWPLTKFWTSNHTAAQAQVTLSTEEATPTICLL